MAKSLDQFADAHEQARYTENADIARANRALRAQLAETEAAFRAVQGKLKLFDDVSARLQTPPKWLTPKRSGTAHVGIPTMLLTDIHWDEVVNPAEVSFANKYNREIAQMRVKKAFQGNIKIATQYLQGITYEGGVLMLGGDCIAGNIHEELRETNYSTVMDSVLAILDPLRAGIDLLAAHYGKLHIAAVVGNHGRNTRKPRAKQRAIDNFDWLIYKLLERELSGRNDVTMQVATGADVLVPIYNTTYLLTHGDQFHGGSGIAGLLSPLLLGVHRKQKRQSALGQPYDIMVMGHWHQSLWFPAKGLIVGGSVVGHSEYEYVSNFTPEPPQCAFWVSTPEHGPTFPAPLFVADRKAEGW